MVKICQTVLLKLNFETRPKKRIFRFLPKISAGHGWSWKFFFANFQILGPLGCQGWVVIPQNAKKKSQNHCTLMYSFCRYLQLERLFKGTVSTDGLDFCIDRSRPINKSRGWFFFNFQGDPLVLNWNIHISPVNVKPGCGLTMWPARRVHISFFLGHYWSAGFGPTALAFHWLEDCANGKPTARKDASHSSWHLHQANHNYTAPVISRDRLK